MEHTKMKHSFIEASAGTGKTYKIMEILAGWMKASPDEKGGENILTKVIVLTFTEKAAGELKERLRKKIIGLQLECPIEAKYSRFLKELDQVTISTIHGFCNMILREYPVETNTCDDWKVTNVNDRLREALYHLKHTVWQDMGIPSPVLSSLLIGTNFFKDKEEQILDTAEKILTGRDYANENFGSFIPSFHTSDPRPDFFSALPAVTVFIEFIENPLNYNYLNKPGKTDWHPSWIRLKEFLETAESLDLESFYGKLIRFCDGYPKSVSNLFASLELVGGILDARKKPAAIRSEFETRTRTLTTLLDNLALPYLESLNSNRFLCLTATHIANKVKQDYESSKWMSYDQMILTVRDALRGNSMLVTALKERYTSCILDEFQDTDAAQYEIFQTLFLNKDEPDRYLYLIGDPKQSIYSFRGTDLGTYLKAKQDINDPSMESLTTNYRSVKELVVGYNRIFSGGKNGDAEPSVSTFFPMSEIGVPNSNISYSDVNVPNQNPKFELSPKFQEGPIQLIKLSEHEKISAEWAREKWNQFIANEILTLRQIEFEFIENMNTNEIKASKQTRLLGFKDVAILVKSRKDGLAVEKELRKKGIPCTFYKQPGIYQSREANQIENILQCLLEPNKPSSYRKLLVSDLFQISPNHLKYFDEHSIDSYEKKILDQWKKLIHRNQFGEFFRSIEEDTRIYFTKEQKNLSWERRRTNYRQILQKLLQFQIQNQATLEEILEELRKWMQEKTSEEEQPLFDKETEDEAVQILTLHASKGLEWAIVFLYHFSEIYKPPTYDYPISTSSGRKWKLSLWEKNSEAYKDYNLNESKRLFYVGITRPQIRLYLPVCQLSGKESPYHKILYTQLQEIINTPSPEFTIRNFEAKGILPPLTVEKISKEGSPDLTYAMSLPHSPLNPERRLFLHSYSSLKKRTSQEDHSTEKVESLLEADTLTDAGLPSSANTGTYLHTLFEELNFSYFKVKSKDELETNPHWKDCREKNLNRFGFPREKDKLDFYRKETLEIMWHSMRARIPLRASESFSLCDLGDFEKISEMDFHYVLEETKSLSTLGNFLKGSMDLVFFKSGKYYIADYKSDRLGSYESEHLTEKIKDSHYDLQRDIYALILYRYLKSFSDEKTALSQFGGVYYLFLRGMREGDDSGIYHDLGTSDQGVWDRERFRKIDDDVNSRVSDTILLERKWRT